MPGNYSEIEKRLWGAADQLRANSSLTTQEYSRPVLGLTYLKYADFRFTEAEKGLSQKTTSGRRTIGGLGYQAKGVMYLPEKARYSYYEYFPAKFAIAEGRGGGEFFTPVSLVSFIAHVLDPESGTVLDPTDRLTFRCLEKNATTFRMAKMNMFLLNNPTGFMKKAN